MGSVSEAEQDDITRLYAAFNRRDIDAVLERLAGDVRWANGMDGGHVEGTSAVRDYWTRQFTVIQSRVEPEEITRAGDGRILVHVHQVVRTSDGELLADQHVDHLYTFNEGKIERFDIGAGR